MGFLQVFLGFFGGCVGFILGFTWVYCILKVYYMIYLLQIFDRNMIGPFSCLLQVPSDALNNGEGAGVSLMSLSLRTNKIEAIRTRAFHGLGQLTKLDLSANRISAVEAGAFEGLDSLQRIYLHSNHLTTLSARDLPASLHGISVHENR